jgi:hypothetical protein
MTSLSLHALTEKVVHYSYRTHRQDDVILLARLNRESCLLCVTDRQDDITLLARFDRERSAILSQTVRMTFFSSHAHVGGHKHIWAVQDDVTLLDSLGFIL